MVRAMIAPSPHFLRMVVLVTLMGSVLTASVHAAGPSADPERRTLAGYRFLASGSVADPFITTHFRNELGYATASGVEFPFIVVDTTVFVSLTGNHAFLHAELEYQHAVSSRLALRFAAQGASRIGTNADALLSQGVNAARGWSAGALFEVWRNERMMVSADARAGHGDVIVIDLIRYTEDVIAGKIADASIVRTDAGVLFDVGVRAAFATSDWSGLTATAGAGANDFGGSRGDVRWWAGATYGMDFGQRGSTPIGLLIKGHLSRLSTESFDLETERSLGLNVSYTGRDDFQIGLATSWSYVPLRDLDVALNIKSTQLTLRYYF